MNKHYFGLVLAMAGWLGICCGGSRAFACGLDGIPSLIADGNIVRLNTQVPTTSAQLAAYTQFISAQSFAIGHRITLTENRREVALSLNAESMRRPWRWRFSDGTVSYGWTVTHAFTRTGSWRVMVDAYYPGDGRWYQFDAVTLAAIRAAYR